MITMHADSSIACNIVVVEGLAWVPTLYAFGIPHCLTQG